MSPAHSPVTFPRSQRQNTGFQGVGLRLLSCLIHLLGVSILSFLFSRRFRIRDFRSIRQLACLGPSRYLVVLILLTSWTFLFAAGLLIQGAGLGLNYTVCSMAVINCIVFYASSKVLIYFFLIEKIHVVWSPAHHSKRIHSPLYVVCFFIVVLYGVVGTVLIIQRISYFRDDGACVIGLKRPASITLLIYDLCINILFTSLFLWPLYKSTFRSVRIRRAAVRTVWAAGVALSTSCINILALTLMKGQQLGWVCLGCCGVDVVINSIAIFWVTSYSESRGQSITVPELASIAQSRPGEDGTFRSSLPHHRSLDTATFQTELSSKADLSLSRSSNAALTSAERQISQLNKSHLPSSETRCAEKEENVSESDEAHAAQQKQFRSVRAFTVPSMLHRGRNDPSPLAIQVHISKEYDLSR
ncbi:uncharacterized protein FIBRA_00659 [Fibroporia radiculosa]|uniref:G-protein coupled receptors family 1 profile domain-containing protein n=1 Tax=Fibroporia radiculosa TaxID=599839 RepID=J4HRZ2_9APHY|nr:uncharacterized protein FIBRA_00659 [Fibroporia radiculosa]CCL98657.1 predicted protein [Fibroporia radiculosa]